MTRLRPREGRDEGSVLVMALVFLSLFGLAVAALLSFADSAYRASAAAHGTVTTQYAADAAVDGAINAIRGDASIGKDGSSTTCFSLPAVVNTTAVSVQCTGRPGSGAGSSGVGGGLAPANSVLTLPTNSSEGVVLSTGATPVVNGSVLTNQSRTVPSGSSLTVQGTLTCKTASGTGTVTAATVACPAATAPSATDPSYAAVFTSVPALAVVPTCPAGSVVSFLPGRYVSAAALNALTGGSCTGKQFQFAPGGYYFEFADPTTHQWLVNDATAEVVGGTVTASAFPNRCDLAAAGVQFVFGADSRLAVSAGSLELCPPLSAGQRIAVYGVPQSTPAVTGTASPVATTAVNSGALAFTNPSAGAAIDGSDATIKLCDTCTASLSLGGYSSTAVPANAVITSAVMNVADARTGNKGFADGLVTAGDGTSQDFTLTPCLSPCTTVEAINVSSLITTPAGANGLSVLYTAADKKSGGGYNITLDGISFTIGYTIPGLTASSGCATSAPYLSGSSCAVLKGSGGATTRMAVKGTVYAPLAAVDLSMTGQLNAVTQRGIVARTLQLGLTPGAGYTSALLSMPGAADRQVLFTASVGGVQRLRADATFADGQGATPGATVTVTRWSVLR